MLGLKNFVRPNILKTKFLHLSIDRIRNYSWQNLTCVYKILNPAPHLLARTATEVCLPSGWICWQKQLGSSKPQEVWKGWACLHFPFLQEYSLALGLTGLVCLPVRPLYGVLGSSSSDLQLKPGHSFISGGCRHWAVRVWRGRNVTIFIFLQVGLLAPHIHPVPFGRRPGLGDMGGSPLPQSVRNGAGVQAVEVVMEVPHHQQSLVDSLWWTVLFTGVSFQSEVQVLIRIFCSVCSWFVHYRWELFMRSDYLLPILSWIPRWCCSSWPARPTELSCHPQQSYRSVHGDPTRQHDL